MKTLFIPLLISLIVTGCQKEVIIPTPEIATVEAILSEQSTQEHTTEDIYVAGLDKNGGAAYWKNGNYISLGSYSMGAVARSIAVVGNDVYVAGEEGDSFQYGNNIAKYWKNGEQVLLTGATGASARSIVVEGNDIYVAGWKIKGGKTVALYWKNGREVYLTDGSSDGEATSIVVSDGNVFISGHENGVAKYWKNGRAVSLSDGKYQAYANSIAVRESDVYVAGSEGNSARLWKNGHSVSLTPGFEIFATANSVSIDKNHVYVTGWEGDFLGRVGASGAVAKYWIDDRLFSLTKGNTFAYANSITVFNGDVYVAGFEGGVAKYWKNGEEVVLKDGYWANSIMVVKR